MNEVQFDCASPMEEMAGAPRMKMAMMRNASPREEMARCASLGEAEEDDAENLSAEYCRRDSSDGDEMPA